MKKIIKIIWAGVTAVLALSCIQEELPEEKSERKPGLMEIEVATAGAEEHDRIHRVRFIIFDNASTFPRLDVNQVIPLEEEQQDAKVFNTTLTVTQNGDKMIVVILNEPDNLTSSLNRISLPSHAEGMMFTLAQAFNPDCTEPGPGGMPMSGAKRGISVTGDNTTEDNPEPVSIWVERSVARVELWLKTEPGITAEINGLTQVCLHKTHPEGYLATGTITDGTRFQTGENAKNNFGRLLAVSDPKEDINWTYAGEQPLVLDDTPRKIVIFYVPERLCDAAEHADKLVLELQNITTSEGPRDATIILREFAPEGSTEARPITEIRRNNIYRVSGRVTSKGISFSGMVAAWLEEDIDLEIED